MTTLQSGLMQSLRELTSRHHEAAESHPFQKALASGELPRDQFVSFLGQLLHVHHAIERHLRHLTPSGALGSVIRDYHYRSSLLGQDLRFFGVEPTAVAPLPATAGLVQRIDQAVAQNPASVLGFHYVLEGSTHGSKFTARSARLAYALKSGMGTSYLDPHGDEQRPRWLAFKQDMDALELAPVECAAAVAAAQEMFAGIVAVGEAVAERHSAER